MSYGTEHTVCKRNHLETNLPGRPPQHRQVSCISIAKWKQLLNSNRLRKTKQPALNLPTTEQQASTGCYTKRKETQNQSSPQI